MGAVHLPLLQIPDEQSLGKAQCLTKAHGGHVPPPQSVSVSFPFLTVSVQVGAWQVAWAQTRLVQSLPVPQA